MILLEILIEEVQYRQKEISRYLKRIRIGNKSETPQKTLANINKFFNGRDDATKFIDDYGSMILEAKRKVAGE